MIEKELQAAVVDMAHRLGWTVAHFGKAIGGSGGQTWRTPAAYDAKGFPDLVMVRERLLFRELKVGKNSLSLEQRMWIDLLKGVGADVGVWTEKEWTSGLIEHQLKAAT